MQQILTKGQPQGIAPTVGLFTIGTNMKLWKLVLVIFLTNSASAFFGNNDLEVLQQNIHINVKEGNAHVEMVTEFYNPTETEIVFQELYPLEVGTEVESFFLDMEGRGYSFLEGKERLESVFEKAKEWEFAPLLGWGSDRYQRLFRSENISVGAQQKVRTKKVFNMPLETQNDFTFLELFGGAFEADMPMEVTFQLEQPVKYFLHSLGDEAMVERDGQTILLWTGANVENLFFAWSDVENAEMRGPFLGMEYRAQFVPKSPKDIEEVTLLVDRSGSLTGLSWQRTKDWVAFLLETFPEDVRVRIGFFAEELAWHNQEFQPNTFEFQKDFFGFLSGIVPVGRTDIHTIFPSVLISGSKDDFRFSISEENTSLPKEAEKGVIIVITDQEALEDAVFEQEIQNPYIVLQFSEQEENDLELFARLSGGFGMKLFRSSSSLVEKDELLDKLHLLNTKVVQPENLEMQEIVPKIFHSQMRSAPFFFTGRMGSSSEKQNISQGGFLSRAWGSQKIAEILKKGNWQTQDFDALLAIGRTFGVSTQFFDQATSRLELEEILSLVSRTELLREILRLESYDFAQDKFSSFDFRFSNEARVKFLNGVPLYKKEIRNPKSEIRNLDVWQQFNFPELVSAETLISIAPFSEAQKQLFRQFPEFVAEGFGMGRNVDFCTELRCISVREGGREERIVSDRAFFKDYDPNHWAHEYIVRAVNEGLLKPELNGKLHPNRAIDRGEFLQLIFDFRFSISDLDTYSYSTFTDVGADSEYAEAIEFLVQKGIIKGYPDGTFRPLQSLTRAEGVKILLAISDFRFSISDLETEKSIFPDVTGWEKPWVEEAVRRGMVKGYGDGTFRPHGKLTRAEALKILFEH